MLEIRNFASCRQISLFTQLRPSVPAGKPVTYNKGTTGNQEITELHFIASCVALETGGRDMCSHIAVFSHLANDNPPFLLMSPSFKIFCLG